MDIDLHMVQSGFLIGRCSRHDDVEAVEPDPER
jgi:hypothetical protein